MSRPAFFLINVKAMIFRIIMTHQLIIIHYLYIVNQ